MASIEESREPDASVENIAPVPKVALTWRDRLRSILTWKVLKMVLLGQTLSLLICGTSVTSTLLEAKYKVSTPTAQSFLNYILLALVFSIPLVRRSGDDNIKVVMKQRWWKYVIVALIDVEANYLVVKAYQYTTLTSIQLLDCVTIPVVLVLSWIFLHSRFKWVHYGGIAVCLLGVGSLVGADLLSGRDHVGGTDKLLGDMLCLLGAALYGVSNVAEEYVVRHFTRVEFLGMLGIFGSVICGLQLAILERHELATIQWTWQVGLLFVGFAVCLFALYTIFPTVIKMSSAVVVNLSILTADLYTLFLGLFLFHYVYHGLYFLAFVLIVAGVVVYSTKPTSEAPPRDYQAMPGDSTSRGEDDPGSRQPLTVSENLEQDRLEEDQEQRHRDANRTLAQDLSGSPVDVMV
ncbi:PREDICTED: LOW QUALITY PROTEIN: solute carrier family 35 member F2-like [Branchiostoma belcheri]|uniref:LOW QUALITY PROTEIN: solute carrier family 35 member F2-like n=1 Tax=Branchiostoma belcheri TaxID=7741 RepID=A0A6P4Y351_BRABE|nr:PREDICTED: LOW QUALITY PROTEIN: solute carrier family 35 member F2-like [Branchiostoma belcheri]